MVREFHKKYGHLISQIPALTIPFKVHKLRVDLIKEEYSELMEAMIDGSLAEIADGLADLIYVVIGTAISYGIPLNRVFNEVHNSNMTKTAVRAEEGAKYGTKTPKGPDYIAPDIEKILRDDGATELETKTSLAQGSLFPPL
jgi:predicted HAD superfamily Cof-like phosphohydrolase